MSSATATAEYGFVSHAEAPRLAKKRRRWNAETRGALILMGPYLLVLLAVGLVPVVYAVVESLTNENGGGFAGLANFRTVISDFRFAPSLEHVGLLLLLWLPIMIVGVVVLALLVDATRGRLGRIVMFLYYIPGALAGMANLMLWLLLLDPTVSPVKVFLTAMGLHSLDQVVVGSSLNAPLILAGMLFFQGAGSWLLIVYGGLNSISDEVLDAARLDGCTAWSMTWRVKLPLIRPWIAYLALMNFAYGFQIFLEPQVVSQAGQGLLSPEWSPNQLSYTYAFQIGDLPGAAALSIILLLITLCIAVLVVTKTGFMQRT